MTAFENAQKFFAACEAPEGWSGCAPYVADGASFIAQSEGCYMITVTDLTGNGIGALTLIDDDVATTFLN